MSAVPPLPWVVAAAIGMAAIIASDLAPTWTAAIGPAHADDQEALLKGTQWLLTSLNDADVDPEIGSSLEFDEDGNVFGNGGCNRFRGVAAIDGSGLKFGNLASTMMACEEAKSGQEAAFHAAMAATVAFDIQRDELLLMDDKQETLARLSPAK